MQIREKTESRIRIIDSSSNGAYQWIGTWLPTNPAMRSKIRYDQVLEVRRGIECRDFNTLVCYGRLCDDYKKALEHIMVVLLDRRSTGRTSSHQEAIEYVLKWFIAKVQGKTIRAPRKAVKKVAKKRVATRIGMIHLNTGIALTGGRMRYIACRSLYGNGFVRLERTTTVPTRVTCGSCQRTNKYRRLRN